jgi:hypothetical protein
MMIENNSDILKDCEDNMYRIIMNSKNYISQQMYIQLVATDTANTENKCETYYKYLPSTEWLEAQKQFVDKLSEKDVLIYYSRNGDRIINNFMRGTLLTYHQDWYAKNISLVFCWIL